MSERAVFIGSISVWDTIGTLDARGFEITALFPPSLSRDTARPTGAAAPERLSALRPPLDSGERSKGANPGRKNAPRERRGVVMSAAKKRTRAEEELAEQRRLAPVLQEAHARLRLWRTCDDKTCRRRGSCGGEVDQCGARDAAPRCVGLFDIVR